MTIVFDVLGFIVDWTPLGELQGGKVGGESEWSVKELSPEKV